MRTGCDRGGWGGGGRAEEDKSGQENQVELGLSGAQNVNM